MSALNKFWETSSSTSSVTYNGDSFYRTYYKEKMRYIMPKMETEMKVDTLEVDNDLFSFNKVIDSEQPETVFHFDPKGIVNKWPDNVS